MAITGDGGRREPRLLDDELKVDFDALRLIPELRAELDSGAALARWRAADFTDDPARWATLAGGPRPGEASPPPAPAALADLSRALFETKVVKDLLAKVADEARSKLAALEREWEHAGAGEKAAMVAAGALVGGSLIGAVVGADPARRRAFELLKGLDIPVPGVEGLSFRVLDEGAAVTLPGAVPGMSVTVHASALGEARPDCGVMVGLDVMKLLRAK